VKVRHADDQLSKLEFGEGGDGGFAPGVVKAFRKRMQQIRAAIDERAFYALASLHYEKLQGQPGQHSMRLNDQWRLIIEYEGSGKDKVAVIVAIKDYH